MKEKLAFESPALEVAEIETEQCFAVSPGEGDGTGKGEDWPDFQYDVE